MKARPWATRAGRWGCIALLLLNVGWTLPATAAGPPIIPIEQLRAVPEQYDGHRIRVIGYLQLGVQDNALYATREDFNNSVTAHALPLALTNAQQRGSSKLNRGHVLVDGVFRAGPIGPSGTPRSSLEPVVRVQMWRKPRK